MLLLPVDIALRRLVITKRDWERAWAATFGRWQPVTVASTPRTEQVSRLFEAKQRAGKESTAPTPVDQVKPAVILRKEEGEGGERPSTAQPASSIKKPQKTAEGGTLASRLLQKKQQQDPDV